MLPLVAEDANGRQESLHQLALTLERFSNTLIWNMQRFTEVGDRGGVETVWTCCVTCLGHLAALSHLLSQVVPSLRSSMNSLCDLTLAKLGDLSHEAPVEVYSLLDVLTQVRIPVSFAPGEYGTDRGS